MPEEHQIELNSNAIDALSGIQRGIEKEGLRFTPKGTIAQSEHPSALGSTLTHPYITTDYSEALLEFITPKQHSIEESLSFLGNLHAYTLQNIGNEEIWPASMPCILEGEKSIRIAEYGTSNVGMMKHVYRRGLGVRYGRIMQAIAGTHYNISFSTEFWCAYQGSSNTDVVDAFRSDKYFHLLRNFHRHSWMLYYLFGASPVLDKSFFDGREHQLQRYGDDTYGLPYATCLRMSDLGYTNSAQKDLHISYDSVDDYINTLSHAVHQPYARYEEIGVKDRNGEYQQLNANILQIENEFYSEIRPKRVTKSGERPVQALRRGGVEYVEVRALDINPYLAVGIDAEQCRFIDSFVLYCLLSNSPQQCPDEWAQIAENRATVIKEGRKPGLRLNYCGDERTITEWLTHRLNGIAESAALLDQAYDTSSYTESVKSQRIKAQDSGQTPSGKIFSEVSSGKEFVTLVKEQSNKHKKELVQDLNKDVEVTLTNCARDSITQQQEREEQDETSFTTYLDNYNQL